MLSGIFSTNIFAGKMAMEEGRRGNVQISPLINREDSDFNDLVHIAALFADMGRNVVLTPKKKRRAEFDYDSIYGSLKGTKYYGKCPDMKVDGEWYEYESFQSENPKNAFRNMLTRGLRQSDRIVMMKPELTERFMRHTIRQRISAGQSIREVWIYNREKLLPLYKKRTADQNGQPPLATKR